MDVFIKFFKDYPSLSMGLLSTIITAFMAEFSFASLIVHVMNVGILCAICMMAKDLKKHGFGVPLLVLLSVGLTALMSKPNELSAIIQIVNFIWLVGMCIVASKEGNAPATPPATS